ncbi:hypothetical protein CDL15_Pgr021648 [Punica granatum]|uniref:mannan endo-1,4-beta-mannosidase n=1 Tax=Punica granatum TaxID=22663 RepID=A0A218WRL5_PUNGR|nr:hypothetical protein CDL15_Pgr021648 [Punica granatum]
MHLIIFESSASFPVIAGLLWRAISGGTYVTYNGNNNGGEFVRINGTHFVVNGKSLYLNGFDAYWLMYMASDPSMRDNVSTTFQHAVQGGMSIGRTFAFRDGEAKRFGLYLTISLVNNWKEGGGRPQHVEWARERGENLNSDDEFYTNSMVKGFYKNHVETVLTRVNSIMEVAYKDGPTIFAWELMNEPRCQDDISGKWVQDWAAEMAAYVKSIDGNHLLEVGLKGFYGTTFPNKQQELNVFVDTWIQHHIQESATILKKPLTIDEFGMTSQSPGFSLNKRDNGYEVILEENPSTANVISQQSWRLSSLP